MAGGSKLIVTWAWTLASAVAGSANAHDLWLEPSSYRPAPHGIVTVRLRVGQDFIGDAVPADPAGIETFVLRGTRRDTPIVTHAGAEPAGRIDLQDAGLHAIGYRSLPSAVSEDAQTFSAFLRDAGLDDVLALRERRGEANGRARQMFSRFAKSLVSVGVTATPGRDRALGFRLELIAERDPYSLPLGTALPVRLMFEGHALAGALVTAISKDAPDEKVKARTDVSGRVRLLLPRGGPWLVRAARVLPAARPPAEWETLWASLTFELPAAGAVGK
jgi:uncharacterized GH25 family protein